MKLAEFLEKLDDVQEDGDGFVARCPAHRDSNPSLRIAITPEGRVLIKDRASCPTPEIMGALGLSMRDLASLRVDDDALLPRAQLSHAEPSPEMLTQLRQRLDAYMMALTPACLEYARARFNINEDEARRLELGTATDLGGGERLVVPFLDADGTAIGFQARALDGDARVRWIGPANVDGVSWSKVGLLRSVTDWDEVIISEGPGDGLTAVGLGHSAVLLRGAGLASNADVVSHVADLVGAGTALLAGDGDAAGQLFNDNLARGLADQGVPVKILAVPAGLDLSSWRERDGDDAVYLAIQAAKRVFDPADVMRDRDLERYPLTDLGQARFLRDFIVAQGSGVRYAAELGFFVLDRGVWAPDSQALVRGYAHGAADRLAELAKDKIIAAGEDNKGEARRWARAVERFQSTNGLNAAINELAALPEVSVRSDAFDQHKDLLAVKNGVVDLRTGELRSPNPRLLITRRVDVAYRPDAQASRWQRFLTEIFPNHDDLPAYMQRLIGYGITGRTDEECFAILHGGGGNGKSKFVGALQHVFGPVSQGVPFSTFEATRGGGIPNDIARLVGARLVFAAEGKANRTMDEALIKQITGKSMMTARFLRKEFFDFMPELLLLFETNHIPKFEGQDEGLWRRIKLIPFERHFKPHERDYGLEQKLINEAEGILAWAIDGARQWYEGGLQDPPSITGATSNLRNNSDKLNGFIPGLFAITRDPADSITAKEIWSAYTEWAAAENWAPNEVGTRKSFLAEVEERGGYRTTDRHKTQIFTGVRRVPPTEGGGPQ